MAGERTDNNWSGRYFYGPVASRRLGLSFGLDIVPLKICTLDCIYCQLGKTARKTIERKDFIPVDSIIAELEISLSAGLKTDFITVAGSGEPTLNSRLGEIIDRIKQITNIPIALVTNGTLFYMPEVRADCAKADLVLPSLDAANEHTFSKINRPHRDISIKKHISGLVAFRNEYPGRIWLEVFLVDSINTDNEQIAEIKTVIEKIRPDKIQLNMAVRPTAQIGLRKLNLNKLQNIAEQLGPDCEIIADFTLSAEKMSPLNEPQGLHLDSGNITQALFSMLKRRPCSLSDICSSLELHPNEAMKYVTDMRNRGLIDTEEKEGKIFFKVIS
ncbi:radical SAM protein [Planctomycetota bacterium]